MPRKKHKSRLKRNEGAKKESSDEYFSAEEEQPIESLDPILPETERIENTATETTKTQKELSALVTKFLELLECGGEQIHLDFKESFFSKDPKKQSSNMAATPKEDNNFLEDIMAMYNADGEPFDSLEEGKKASYLVYGIRCANNEMLSTSFKNNSAARDQSRIQNLVQSRLTPDVDVRLHEVTLDLAQVSQSRKKTLSFLEETDSEAVQTYYLLEILHDRTAGPLVAKLTTDKKKACHGERNEIAEVIYTRTQATNRKLRWHNKTDAPAIAQVMAKFSSGVGQFQDQLFLMSHSVLKDSVFRILVLNPPQITNKEQFKAIASALDKVDWNIIIDLDVASRSTGYYSKMERTHYKTWELATHRDLLSLDQNRRIKKDEIKSGSQYLYLLLCGDKTLEQIEVGGVPKFTNVCNLLSGIFSKWDTNDDLEVFAFSSSCQLMSHSAKLISQIETTWTDVLESRIQECKVYSLSSHKSTLIQERAETTDWKCAVSTVDQITTFFKDMSKNLEVDIGEVRIPSSGNQERGVSIGSQELAIIEKVFYLYHLDGGNTGEIEETELCKLILATRKEFLQGQKLNMQSLYIHEHYEPIYSERKLTREVLNRVLNRLSAIEQGIRNHEPERSKTGEDRIIHIQHEPSAGGTTVGRILLWEIRMRYPCVELKVLKDETWEDTETALRILYFDKARKPICVLIDTSTVGSTVSKKDVKDLFLEKTKYVVSENECLEVLVIFVEEVTVLDPKANEKAHLFNLSTVLDKKEQDQFNKLFVRAAEKLKHTERKTVTLYGACQFQRDEYKQLETIIGFMKSSSPLEKDVLIFTSVLYKYAELPLSIILLLKICEVNERNRNIGKILEVYLKIARNILLVTKPASKGSKVDGIRPPSKYIAAELLKNRLAEEPLKKFVWILLNLTDATPPVSNVVNSLIFPVFTQRLVIFDDQRSGMKEKFSNFIIDLEQEIRKRCPSEAPEKTAELLKEFVDKLSQCRLREASHCRAMYARYLFLKCKNIDAALEEMAKALSVRPGYDFTDTKETDPILLTITGHFLSVKLSTIKDTEDFRLLSKSIMEEALELFRRAQDRTPTAYHMEAKLRIHYLYHFFEVECEKNRENFSRLLRDSRDPFIKNALDKIWAILGEMEEKMYTSCFDSSDEYALTEAGNLKMKILNLIVDTQDKSINWLEIGLTDRAIGHCVVPLLLHNQGMKFEGFNNEDMSRILGIYKKHYATLEREHLRQAILAQMYIYRRTQPRFLRKIEDEGHSGSTLLALELAEKWAKSFKNDYRALFYWSVILLGSALCTKIEKREDKLNAFWEVYKRALDMHKHNTKLSERDQLELRKKSVIRRELNFVIQESEYPLSVMVPRDTSYLLPIKSAAHFRGTADDMKYPRNLFCKELSTARHRAVVEIPIHEYRRVSRKGSSRPIYDFFLQITPHGLVVERVYAVDQQKVMELSFLQDSPRR